MKVGKGPGPGGLCAKFYKKFKPKLLTPLLEMFLEVFHCGNLPNSLTEALITLLTKPGRPRPVWKACLKHEANKSIKCRPKNCVQYLGKATTRNIT